MTGLKNLIDFIVAYWPVIVLIVGAVAKLAAKIKNYLEASEEEQIEAQNEAIELAKQNVRETILRYVIKAEKDYSEWVKAGVAKRAQVIDEILANYPILQEVTDREEIIAFLDSAIDASLEVMRSLIKEKAQQ